MITFKDLYAKIKIWAMKANDLKIFLNLGRQVYIRNGIGFGFISDQYLYDNCFLEVGFGRTISGHGDWGGGADHATTCPLKVVVDRNLIIQRVTTDSFYNSKSSQLVEEVAKKLAEKLIIGEKLIVEDEKLKESLAIIFSVIPRKSHIGWDLYEYPHMGQFFTDPKKQNEYNFEDPKCLQEGGVESCQIK